MTTRTITVTMRVEETERVNGTLADMVVGIMQNHVEEAVRALLPPRTPWTVTVENGHEP